MAAFLSKRLLSGLVTLFLFVSLLFVLAKLIMAGDFVSQFQFSMSAEERAALRDGLGLTLPIWRQYVAFVGSLFTGGLGTSYSGYSVASIVWENAQYTALLFMVGMGLAYVAGQKLGRIAAWRSPSRTTNAITVGAVMFYTVFPVLLAVLLMVAYRALAGFEGFLAMRTIEDPEAGPFWAVPATIAGMMVLAIGISWWRTRRGGRPLPALLGFVIVAGGSVLVWTLLGKRSMALDWIYYLTLPILAVALLAFGEITLIVKGAMSDIRREDFIQTARAKGLPETTVRDRHAARAAMLPIVSKLIVAIPFFLAGLVIIETAFVQSRSPGLVLGVPGLSATLFASFAARDTTFVIGSLFVIGLLSLVLRLGLDVALAVLDPRIRYEAKRIQ